MANQKDSDASLEGRLGLRDTLASSALAEFQGDEAEAGDLRHLVENSCIACNAMLRGDSVRIVPPGYIQERDPYVRKGLVHKRMMCVSCYNNLGIARRNRLKRRSLRDERVRSPLLKETINAFLFGSL
jgi:hypothetical protein